MIKGRGREYMQKFGLLWDWGISDADVWVSAWLRACQGGQLCWVEEGTAPAWPRA